MSTWAYNGSNTLTVDTTFADSDQAAGLYLTADDDNHANTSDSGSIGDPVTLTLTTIGGLSAGDEFIVQLFDDPAATGGAEDQTLEARVFVYGTADAGTPLDFSWDYDGAATLVIHTVIDDPESVNGVIVRCDDPDSTVYSDGTPGAAGSDLDVTINDIGGLSGGDPFGLAIFSGIALPREVSAAAFLFGTPSSGSLIGGPPPGRTELALTAIGRDGVAPPAQTDSDASNGMYVAANDGRVLIEITSEDGADQTVGFAITETIDEQPAHDKTVTIPAGARFLAGPFPEYLYNQADGSLAINPSVDGTLKLRAYACKRDVIILDG